ncbi:hypothetical protein AGMMS50262_11640 [Bacteroidia bacterium]|nr:hypothetical protein AGMMS50262_11640 [Bacteroidia bacterium]
MIQLLNILTGFSISKTCRSIAQLPSYYKSFFALKKQIKRRDRDFLISANYPCLLDKFESGGVASGDYFHHDLYVAQQIFKRNPVKHLDIGSRIDGFVAHVASFRKIEVMDIRQIDVNVENISFIQHDVMQDDEKFHNYCDSLSCISVLEHFGLGRYGDSLDIDGHIKGLTNIAKMLKSNGICYIAVPIGFQRIEYNAHFVFSIRYLIDLFEKNFNIQQFAYVDKNGDFFEIPLTEKLIENNCGCREWGSGIFVLTKK